MPRARKTVPTWSGVYAERGQEDMVSSRFDAMYARLIVMAGRLQV